MDKDPVLQVSSSTACSPGRLPTINKLLGTTLCTSEIKESAKRTAKEVEDSLYSKLKAGLAKTSLQPLPKNYLMNEKTHLKKPSRIEETLRKEKLRELLKMKHETESKLLTLNETVSVLTNGLNYRGSRTYDTRKQREESAEKQAKAFEFIKKISVREKDRKKRIQQKYMEDFKKFQEEFDWQETERSQKRAEQLSKKKLDRIQQFEMHKQKREEEFRKLQEHERSFKLHDSYLYAELEEKYKEKFVLPMLELRKSELSDRKAKLKSVTKEELVEHQRRRENFLMLKRQERRRSQEKERIEQKRREEGLGRYKNNIFQQIKEHEEKERQELEMKILERRKLRKKMYEYSSLIKEVYPVRPSESKAKELQKIIEKIKHPSRKPRDIKKDYDISRIRQARSVINTSKITADQNTQRSSYKLGKKQADDSIYNINSTKVQGSKKIDYLTNMRKQREERYRSATPCAYSLNLCLDNLKLDSKDKIEAVERKVEKMELQARRQEKLLGLNESSEINNIEVGERVSNMFIEAIKAKLEILNHLQQYRYQP
eukprot:TRINITY_DN140_c1_g1_i1.p3 TRINITY_DN140_c1_g1~~TRINITY_DN140_c1_g1_i1.p3  ORF type:complete len:544 (+),score=81.66 TRINITY_DN140_c1_g1_i1:10460-12091(+)